MKHQIKPGQLILIALFLLIVAGNIFAQNNDKKSTNKDADNDQEIVLEFKTQLVVVPFSALDNSNRNINDLKASEIKLFENGQPAQIVSLQRAGNENLNFALLLDLSGSMEPYLDETRAAAERFFQHALKPTQDQAAIMGFQQQIIFTQPLTDDQKILHQSLARKTLLLPAASRLGRALDGDPHRISGTALYGALYLAVDEVLQNASGHRVIVLISDGYDSDSGIELRDVLDYAWRKEVTIYTIGLGDKAALNREVLERLGSATGGRAFYPENAAALDNIFAQIDNDLRQQYVLSFYPNNNAENNFRTIKIEVPNRPTISIRHRFGYYNASNE